MSDPGEMLQEMHELRARAEKAERERDEARAALAAFDGWQPTAAAINALPAPLRRYIHDLETRCDPAGDVQRLALAQDTARGLERERDEAMALNERQAGRIANLEADVKAAAAWIADHLAQVARLERERDEARAKAADYHRRAQAAEAEAAKLREAAEAEVMPALRAMVGASGTDLPAADCLERLRVTLAALPKALEERDEARAALRVATAGLACIHKLAADSDRSRPARLLNSIADEARRASANPLLTGAKEPDRD